MKWNRHLRPLSLLLLVAALSASPAYAMEYTFEDDAPYYGKSTSVEVVQSPDSAPKNEDRSKNAAVIPPSFGSATSNVLNSGKYLTPDLVPSAMAGAGVVINGSSFSVGSPGGSGSSMMVLPPFAGGTSVNAGASADAIFLPGTSELLVDVPTAAVSSVTTGYTEVTSNLYDSKGSLGTLSIPSIGVKVGIYQGTDSATLAKGAGHFEDSSIWDGNVGLAAHNRGTNAYFGEIHTLSLGDTITLTTALGTRTYAVTSVSKVLETDSSGLAVSDGNMISLYTCVRDERDYRWCVQGVQVG